MEKIKKLINNLSEEEVREMLYDIILNDYCVVPWPDSQDYMSKKWFRKEAILDTEAKFGSSAYFVPLHRFLK